MQILYSVLLVTGASLVVRALIPSRSRRSHLAGSCLWPTAAVDPKQPLIQITRTAAIAAEADGQTVGIAFQIRPKADDFHLESI
jgi:hypothetical protein